MKSTSPSLSKSASSRWESLTSLLCLVALAALLAAGCATTPDSAEARKAAEAETMLGDAIDGPPEVGDDRFTPYWLDMAKRSQARQPVNVEHAKLSIPPIADTPGNASRTPLVPPQPEPELPTHKVSLVMRDTETIDVLQALARAADMNILVSPEIQGITTVELRDVPWNEAFAGLLANLGLHHRWMGGILRVMTAEGLKKEVEMEKLEKERELLRYERRQVEPLVLQTIPIHYANATKLQPILENLLTAVDHQLLTNEERNAGLRNRQRGTVTVDEENNALVINALRDDIIKMIEVIEALDRPKPQVLIEAKIIVANRETARELGFQWGGLYHGGNSYLYPGSSTGVNGTELGTALLPVVGSISNFPSASLSGNTTSTGDTTTDTTTTDTSNTSTAGANGLNLGYAYQNIGNVVLTAQLTALESEGKAQIIACPSISTLDNEEASLKSGFEIPYQSYSDTEGNEVSFKEALLELTVTPHVIDGRMVKIKLIASNDEPDYSRVDTGVTEEPAISRNTAETSLLLFHGETTVIGGLSRTYGTDSVSGVPILKDLPWLGKLFSSKAREKRQEDILIFITPYILGERDGSSPLATGKPGEPAEDTEGAKTSPEAANP